MYRNHCLTPSRASHDRVRAPLSDPFTPEPLDSAENLPTSQLSISLDSLAGPASIRSLSQNGSYGAVAACPSEYGSIRRCNSPAAAQTALAPRRSNSILLDAETVEPQPVKVSRARPSTRESTARTTRVGSRRTIGQPADRSAVRARVPVRRRRCPDSGHVARFGRECDSAGQPSVPV